MTRCRPRRGGSIPEVPGEGQGVVVGIARAGSAERDGLSDIPGVRPSGVGRRRPIQHDREADAGRPAVAGHVERLDGDGLSAFVQDELGAECVAGESNGRALYGE